MSGVPKAGSKMYKGVEIPINAKIFTIESGHECYLTGLHISDHVTFALVYVIDKKIIINVDYNKIKKYL